MDHHDYSPSIPCPCCERPVMGHTDLETKNCLYMMQAAMKRRVYGTTEGEGTG